MLRRIANAALSIAFVAVCGVSAIAQEAQQQDAQQNDAITSRVETSEAGDIVLVQEVIVNSPLSAVWDAFTTTEGWKGWVTPVAEVDFKAGGTVRTNYNPQGSVDDEDANTLHVINFVPRKLITFQAELAKSWPEILKEREKLMYNVILFEELEAQKTKIVSYGTGYRDSPELRELLDFFVTANEATYVKLIEYLEGEQ